MSYVDTISFEIKEWTANKVKSNPKVFGTRQGNALIIKEFFNEVQKGVKAEDLSLEAISTSVAVSRARNIFIQNNPQYDYRGQK